MPMISVIVGKIWEIAVDRVSVFIRFYATS